jgi:NAD(P)-dependent dehydrogenase (short-subunit alcohol dehydrogenase family)
MTDPQLIPGKVALVTGSTRGLGRHIAHRLAISGADVILHDVDPSQAALYGEAAGPEEVVNQIQALGRRCGVLFGDLCQREAADRIAAEALARFEKVDILVNCAGGDIGAAGGKPVPNDCLEIPDEDVRVILDRNLLSTMHMCRAVCPGMVQRGQGSIVNIASLAGMVGCDEGSVYAVAKAAVIHWTRCLAMQVRPHGITVNTVSPGATKSARFLASRPVAAERLADTGRLTRLGEPDDIARVCLFFASDLAAFVTGQNLEVSGQGR